jgi:hypothetical protein
MRNCGYTPAQLADAPLCPRMSWSPDGLVPDVLQERLLWCPADIGTHCPLTPGTAANSLALRSWHYDSAPWLPQDPDMAYPTDEQVRIRAHQLWEQAGKPEGRQDEFWHLAEQELLNEDRSSPLRTPDDL